jgi:hypothetical protein
MVTIFGTFVLSFGFSLSSPFWIGVFSLIKFGEDSSLD